MKYIILLSFVYLYTVVGIDSEKYSITAKANSQTDSLKFDTAKYAVFNIDKIRGDLFQLFAKSDRPTELIKEDYAKIEALTNKAVLSFNKVEEAKNRKYIQKERRKYPQVKIATPNPVVGNPANYYKQLVPVINSNNERIVWVRCVCQKDKSKWKTDISLVEDGGSCYFNLKINLTKNIYSDFALN